jgi:penicillin amidase
MESWNLFQNAAILLRRDDNGLIHVKGETLADIYYGWGFAHGTDRALQLTMWRILMEGRASELLSSTDEMLAIDSFFRCLNLYRQADEQVDGFDAGERQKIESFCNGFNSATKQRWPMELRLVRCPHLLYRPRDVVALTRFLAYMNLAQTQGEFERLFCEMVQAGVPESLLRELFPLEGLPVDWDLIKSVRLGRRISPAGLCHAFQLPQPRASNNWVISGTKSRSGKPILADDPHLDVGVLPAVWYEVVLELPSQCYHGAGMPGLPALMLGRNQSLAWGLTYAFLDGVDSWVEECRDNTYRRVKDEVEEWIPFAVRNEVIRRRGKKDVTLTFHENSHGTLDGDPGIAGRYLCTKWATAESGLASLRATMRILNATTAHEALDTLGTIESAWNWVAADSGGNIGYQMSGLLPRRANGTNGFIPLKGWEPANDWQGFYPPTDLPRAYNPPENFLVTANHNLNHHGNTPAINAGMSPERARRIEQELAKRNDWDVAACQKLQVDTLSLQAESFMQILRPLLPATPQGEILRSWDLRYETDSQGAFLFERFYDALVRDVFGRLFGREFIASLLESTVIYSTYFGRFDALILNAAGAWYNPESQSDCFARIARTALAIAPQTWGSSRPITMRHLFWGGKLPRWLGFDHGPIALRGGRATVHQAQCYYDGKRPISAGPSIRFVTDLAECKSHSVLAGGLSERRFSRWYRSDIARWLAGELKTTEVKSCHTP